MMRRAMVLALGTFLTAATPPRTLRPPLDSPLALTSSFGEFRRGHYHGGLDLSTGGREGLPVRAPDAGWVYRVRASGVGYGRAIYFRLGDGRTVLFGHLSRFAPGVEAVVEAEQDRRGSYEIDLYPEPHALSFSRGEVLGYTGSSGAGPPHLHAEIRTGREAAEAVNPLFEGWSIPDSVPPAIPRLRVEPARPGVLVGGRTDPVVLSLSGTGSARSLSITGPVRLWVEATDKASGEGYRLLPYRVGFSVDGVERADVTFDAFDWNRAREVEWTFDSPLARSRSEPWIRLEALPGAGGSVARGVKAGEDWTHDLAVGSHRLVVDAADAAGNHTERELRLDREPDAGDSTRIREAITHYSLESKGNYLELHLRGPAGVEGVTGLGPSGQGLRGGWVVLTGDGGEVAQLGQPDPADPGLWRFSVRTASGDSALGEAIWVGREGGGQALWSPRTEPWIAIGSFRLRFAGKATYTESWITVRRDPVRAPASPGQPDLVPRSGRIELGPWAFPLRRDLDVEWFSGGLSSRRGLALYSWHEGSWAFEGSDTSGDGVGARVSSLETVALLEDRTPPAVTVDAPGGGAVRRLTAAVHDRGAGVSASGVRMLVDGRPVIAEWDPEERRVTGYLRAPLAPGSHEVVVEATDRVGNRGSARRSVVVG